MAQCLFRRLYNNDRHEQLQALVAQNNRTMEHKIPNEHQHVMPYLLLNHPLDFLDFVQTVFDAREITRRMLDDYHLMHAEVMIGLSTIMVSECSKEWPYSPAGLFVYVEDADACYEKALANGATSVLPIQNKDYGRSGGVKDPFGNTWWITSIK